MPIRRLAAIICLIALGSVSSIDYAQTQRPDPGPLIIAHQGSFFIGGRDVKSDTLSTLPGLRVFGDCHRRSDVCAVSSASGDNWELR
jgi:hypothetical protein